MIGVGRRRLPRDLVEETPVPRTSPRSTDVRFAAQFGYTMRLRSRRVPEISEYHLERALCGARRLRQVYVSARQRGACAGDVAYGLQALENGQRAAKLVAGQIVVAGVVAAAVESGERVARAGLFPDTAQLGIARDGRLGVGER